MILDYGATARRNGVLCIGLMAAMVSITSTPTSTFVPPTIAVQLAVVRSQSQALSVGRSIASLLGVVRNVSFQDEL